MPKQLQIIQAPPKPKSTKVTIVSPPIIYAPNNDCCGCSRRVGAIVVATFEIVCAVIQMIQASVAMGSKNDFTSSWRQEYTRSYDFDPKYSMIAGFASLVHGLVLAAGIYYKKQALLVIWLVFCGIEIGILVIGTILLFVLFLDASTTASFIVLAVGLVVIIILSSCFNTVNHHRKELADAAIQYQSNPVVQFAPAKGRRAKPTV